MLLAAGLGTRLSPLTESLPKPVVPVANRPLATFAIEHLARVGTRTIVANTHPQAETVERILAQGADPAVDLRFSRESILLGTGGGVRRAWSRFPDRDAPVVVMNGDTLFAPDLAKAYDLHCSRGAVATMILRRTDDPERYGAVAIDRDGRVKSLLGSPKAEPSLRTCMFTGVHILAPEASAALPESGCIIRSAYRRWVDTGALVLGVVDDSSWADLGTLAEYHRVNLELASGGIRWPGVMPRGGNLWDDATAEACAGQHVENSVVGAGVHLEDGVSLERCVVWPGTHVSSSATNAIVTPDYNLAIS
ncbi:MAG: sugar phosphate nucleotidyltransferase [Myxococcota bacterium]